MTIELKRGVVYGPVRSRRLGRSLGINLLPPRRKVCRFDCAYCQYGRTACFEATGLDRELPTVEQALAAVEAALHILPEPPEWLTFSGNGEPTLHPDFSAMVEGVIGLRDRFCPGAHTALLSCSTEAGRPEVRAALERLDARVMKLDAGSEELLRAYNRPAPGVTLEAILDGLGGIADVTLQTLFTGGEEGNFTARNLNDWLGRVVELRPRAVQLYSLDRPTAAVSLEPIARRELEAVAAVLRREGVEASVYCR